jgi:nucleoid DNA-binding protein
MKREDLRKIMARGLNVEPNEARIIIDALCESFKDVIAKHRRLTIRGFGEFYLIPHRGPQQWRCPLNGKIYSVRPARWTIRWKPSPKNLPTRTVPEGEDEKCQDDR